MGRARIAGAGQWRAPQQCREATQPPLDLFRCALRCTSQNPRERAAPAPAPWRHIERLQVTRSPSVSRHERASRRCEYRSTGVHMRPVRHQGGVSGKRITNSSPPMRAATSPSRRLVLSRRAVSMRTWSPTMCDSVSLMSLKLSRSSSARHSGR